MHCNTLRESLKQKITLSKNCLISNELSSFFLVFLLRQGEKPLYFAELFFLFHLFPSERWKSNFGVDFVIHCFQKTTDIKYVKASKLCININHITWGSTKSEPHMPANYSQQYSVISHYHYQILSVSVIFQQSHGHFRQFILLKLLHYAANLIQYLWEQLFSNFKIPILPSHGPQFFAFLVPFKTLVFFSFSLFLLLQINISH